MAKNKKGDGALVLVPDNTWTQALGRESSAVDPCLRLVVTLIEARAWDELFRRTGIAKPADGKDDKAPTLALLIELARDRAGKIVRPPDKLRLKIPEAYFEEAKRNKALTQVTAQLGLDREIYEGKTKVLRQQIVNTLREKSAIVRVSLATPLQPCLEDSIADIGMPPNREYKNIPLNGNGIIIGIIDDGCAFAHQDFLVRTGGNANDLQSRVLYLWDQSNEPKPNGVGWSAPAGFNSGFEIGKQAIDIVLGKNKFVHDGVVEATQIYDYLGYRIYGRESHGTHVMSIAAGNGRSLMGAAGVAPKADIIFVQLPQGAIKAGSGDPVLYDRIREGVEYIFSRAQALGKPAVVNISYGGYMGPHDGTSHVEAGIDQLLTQPDRTVVVAAGNGFEADCHASGTVKANASSQKPLKWVIRPEDPTTNYLEIWYNGDASLELVLTPPKPAPALPPVKLGAQCFIQSPDGKIVGIIDHNKDQGNGDILIKILLTNTVGEERPPLVPINLGPAPSGIWTIELKNTSAKDAEFHAWIERDVSGGRGSWRRQQSHFVPDEADPGLTLGTIATGLHTIAVGAYNSATQELCRYTACGPTRKIGNKPGTERRKPEFCAPSEEDPAGRGILSASSLSSMPTRMNGTSASAPHVAGVVALIYQYILDSGHAKLSADQIRDLLRLGAQKSPRLKLNRHQEADATRPNKQSNVPFDDLAGAGKLNLLESLKLL